METTEMDKDYKTMVADFERGLIEAALQASAGHQRRAAASVALPLPAATSRTFSSQRRSQDSASCSPTICRVVPMTA